MMSRYDRTKVLMQLALFWIFLFAQAHFYPFDHVEPLALDDRLAMIVIVGLPYLFLVYQIGFYRNPADTDQNRER